MDRMLHKPPDEAKSLPLIEVMVAIATIGILVAVAMQKFLAH